MPLVVLLPWWRWGCNHRSKPSKSVFEKFHQHEIEIFYFKTISINITNSLAVRLWWWYYRHNRIIIWRNGQYNSLYGLVHKLLYERTEIRENETTKIIFKTHIWKQHQCVKNEIEVQFQWIYLNKCPKK